MWRPRCPAEEARTGCRAVRGAERVSFRTSGRLTFPPPRTNPTPARPGNKAAKQATARGQLLGLTGVQPQSFFHGCGTQNQNFADRQHPGVRGDYPVLSLLQDPGPLRGADPDRAHLRPETKSQERKSFQLNGQAVHPAEAGEAGGCGLQPTQR